MPNFNAKISYTFPTEEIPDTLKSQIRDTLSKALQSILDEHREKNPKTFSPTDTGLESFARVLKAECCDKGQA